MGDNRRNITSGIFLLGLLFVFISFSQRERSSDKETTRFVISNTTSSGVQAILIPAISSPGTGIGWIKNTGSNFFSQDTGTRREILLNNQLSGCCKSCRLEFRCTRLVIGFIFPQKVPEQGNDDDIPSIILNVNSFALQTS
ncbi:MAG TPA: hypothetical protein PKG48_01000 [Bacteroidales bacterium]|nr:hypothetical protein [Bacteroidales bacterium]